MGKIYTALGLMSGTSLDGVDISIIESDGIKQFTRILDRYYEYEDKLTQKISKIREKIKNLKDFDLNLNEIQDLEREITLFNAKVIKETLITSNFSIDIIGYHGQTIFHDPSLKTSKQLGDAKLLSQLLKKNVIYNFRQNDLENGGQGAPLTPIFHNIIANKIKKDFNLEFPINILNIGGIANVTATVDEKNLWSKDKIYAYDIGPGNCLIDDWIKRNSKQKYDNDGMIASSGTVDSQILNQAYDNLNLNTFYETSLDVKDFDIFFARGLSLENGAATITEFTAKLISDGMKYLDKKNSKKKSNWLVCGGGRKNKYLFERIKKNFKDINLDPTEKYDIDGDFIESQAFAFLAIRSLEKLPISFPSTTRCKKPLTGGILVNNF